MCIRDSPGLCRGYAGIRARAQVRGSAHLFHRGTAGGGAGCVGPGLSPAGRQAALRGPHGLRAGTAIIGLARIQRLTPSFVLRPNPGKTLQKGAPMTNARPKGHGPSAHHSILTGFFSAVPEGCVCPVETCATRPEGGRRNRERNGHGSANDGTTGAVLPTPNDAAGMSKDRGCTPSMRLSPIFACVLAGKISQDELLHT